MNSSSSTPPLTDSHALQQSLEDGLSPLDLGGAVRVSLGGSAAPSLALAARPYRALFCRGHWNFAHNELILLTYGIPLTHGILLTPCHEFCSQLPLY